MKKGINKNVFTLVALVAVLALVAAYFLGYKKYTDLATTTQNNNVTLQAEVDALKVHYINKAQYEADMIPMKEGIHAIMEKYPADTKAEDVIMNAVYTQVAAPVSFSNISIGEKKSISSVSKEVVLATAQEDMQEGISFVEKKSTYVHKVDSYEGLKKLVQASFDSKYNLAITDLNYSRAEGGSLSGTMKVSFYSMTGNGKTYEEPEMIPYTQGTGNIFGFVTVYKDEDGNIIAAPLESSEETTDTAEGDAPAEPAA